VITATRRGPDEPRRDRISGSFQADIEFDADGPVTVYHGYLERIA